MILLEKIKDLLFYIYNLYRHKSCKDNIRFKVFKIHCNYPEYCRFKISITFRFIRHNFRG